MNVKYRELITPIATGTCYKKEAVVLSLNHFTIESTENGYLNDVKHIHNLQFHLPCI